MNRLVATASLNHYGLEVTEAENGLVAVEWMRKRQFDLVLMDVQMPEMDGVTATVEIRKFDTHTPIVALSANAFQREIDQCLASGMNDYVLKPFDEVQLLATIHRLCLVEQVPVPASSTSAGGPQAQPLYHLKKVRDIARGNELFVKQMVDLFLDEAPRVFANMEIAWAAQDYPKLKGLAHRIKPSVEAMGMGHLHKVVKEIETISGTAPEAAALRELLDTAQGMLEEVLAALRADFG